MVMRHDLTGRSRPAQRIDVPLDPGLAEGILPIGRIRNQGPVFQVRQSFGCGQDRHGRVQFHQDILQEPVHAIGRNGPDHEIAASDRVLPLLTIIIGRPGRIRPVQFRMPALFQAGVDDFPVHRCADEPENVAVFRRHESQGRAHLADTDNGNDCHSINN